VVAVVQPDAGDIHLDLDDVGIDAVDGGAECLEQHVEPPSIPTTAQAAMGCSTLLK